MNKNPLSEPFRGEFGFLFIDKRRSKIRKSTYLCQNDGCIVSDSSNYQCKLTNSNFKWSF
jgi:hypothetical protein